MVNRVFILAVSLSFCWPALSLAQETADLPEVNVPTPGDQVEAVPFTSQELLPASTKAWISVKDVEALKAAIEQTQFGAMGRDEDLKPFVESIKSQFQDWLNSRNVRLGFKIEQIEEVQTGEICIAGVLQANASGEKLVRGSHGMVLLVNVAGSEKQAEALMAQVAANFKDRGAVEEPMDDILGAKITKFKIEKKELNHVHSTYYTISQGWMLASDNESVFRKIIRRLARLKNLEPKDTLAAQPAFQSVMEKSTIEGVEHHVRWFVDPFGYVKLAQAIADDERVIPQQRNDKAEILENEGFDAFRGLGGQFAFAINSDPETAEEIDYEFLHRTYLYAPRDKASQSNQQSVFGLFDFENKNNLPLEPQPWIPQNVSTHLALTWEIRKAFDNVGFVVDAFMGEETWDATLESLRTDPDIQVNLPKLVDAFGNEVTVMSATEHPINEESERIVIGVPLKKGQEDFAFESILRALGRGDAKEIVLSGYKVIEQDTTVEPEIDPLGGGLSDLDIDSGMDDFSEEEQEEEFKLFEKRYITILQNDGSPYLLVANDKYYLKKILDQKSNETLSKAADYIQVKDSLGKFVAEDKVSFRQFARIDQALQVNYEMLRQGKMASSKTVLARILNKVMVPQGEVVVEPREQKIKGGDLPSDFEKDVAPYFGPSGWVIETEDDGWRLTGCILKKKPLRELVRIPDAGPTR